jgi:hypothetical protein
MSRATPGLFGRAAGPLLEVVKKYKETACALETDSTQGSTRKCADSSPP